MLRVVKCLNEKIHHMEGNSTNIEHPTLRFMPQENLGIFLDMYQSFGTIKVGSDLIGQSLPIYPCDTSTQVQFNVKNNGKLGLLSSFETPILGESISIRSCFNSSQRLFLSDFKEPILHICNFNWIGSPINQLTFQPRLYCSI